MQKHIAAIGASISLVACAPADSRVERANSPTVIYSPPVKLGGRGSILILNSGQAGSDDGVPNRPFMPSREGEILSALHLFLTKGDTSVCLNPIMGYASIAETDWADTREELRDNGVKHPSARQIKEHLIEDSQEYRWSGWSGFDETKKLSPQTAREVADAHVEMARRVPKQRVGMRLRQDEMSEDVALKEGCIAFLRAPAIRGDWAFVGMDMYSAGYLYALRRIDGRWSVIGSRGTWLN